jgi:FlaG/FlaF family flagellin (archaellin)
MINKRLLGLAAAGVLVLGMASIAMAGIPDPTNSTASGPSGCISITPAGTGVSLASKSLTINVTVLDGSSQPIAGYAFQDITWNSQVNGELAMCNGGSVSDGNTNALGQTTISGTAAGGGWTLGGVNVFLAGVKLNGGAVLLDVNSADNTGDLAVNLADIGDFSIDFNAPGYDFRSDLTCDGVENLADVGDIAIANGQFCP